MDHASKEDAEAMFTRLFQEAAADMGAGRLAEAAEKLDTLLAALGPHPDVLWNLGTARSQLGQHDRALAAWDAYRRVAPDDWRARPKVIQACQALGDTARRDRERADLLALRQAGADPGLAEEPQYCREQFRVGDHPVVAYEVFEPTGERRVFYTFLVGQPDGTMIGRYSLGSYDSTTGISRETGKIGPEERIYHLDWYDARGHATHGFFSRLLDYDETRAHVLSAMTGALPSVSSVAISPESGQPAIYLSQQAPPATMDTRMAHEIGVLAAGELRPSPPRHAPPPPAPPPPGARAAGSRGGAPAGPLERITSWVSRMMGRRDDRPN